MAAEAQKAAKTEKSSAAKWIHMIVMFVLLSSGWALPTVGGITPFGMKVLGIFVGLIYGWMFVGLIWPSLTGMMFLSFAGLGTAKAVFGQGYGSEIVLLIIFFGVFTKWLEDIGLTNTFAQFLLTRKFLAGRPYLFIFMIFFVTFMCGFFVGIYATIFLMWGICYRMLLNWGYEKRDKTSAYILIGVAYVSIMGMTIKPWSPWSLLGTSAMTNATGLAYDFLPYSTFMTAVSLVSILLYMLAGKFIIGIDTNKMKNADYAKLGTKIDYTVEQKIGSFLLVFILVALYLPSTLDKESALYAFLNNLGPVGVVAIVTIFLCIMTIGQKPLLDFAATAAQGVPWNMICLLAAVGPLGSALMSENAQITPAILGLLKPILAGQSPFVMYALIVIISLVLTQFMNNTVLLVALTPILCKIAGLVGANPMIITALLVFGLSAALATPGASSRAGLVFGNVEWITNKDAYFQSIISVACVMIALLVIGLPLGMLLF